MASLLPAPRRITASNLSLPSKYSDNENAEPGVEVHDDKLTVEALGDGSYRRAVIGTSTQVPTSNDGHGELALDNVPGAGIVMPGGLNTYYLDIAPNTEGPLHRTTSTDYIVVISGKLSLITPKPEVYEIKDGKASCADELVETVALPGDVIYQRGPIHSLSNRTNEWVRALCIVVGSEPNKVHVEGSSDKVLDDKWLA
ncbi:Putative Cupin 2 [[Torrubiella] hemipterigena]|uniref:Putative Cupin 2 n=1 Tax=[Torrubiella] hemipterigena TaxID=1531966 RepID=A0A0A1TMA8_9HYPO|nr:Putative Cupin 2 [[Torrubiella] hemipterigena]